MNQQRGTSLMGFLGFLIVAGFLAFLAMRLFPVYSEHHSVVSSMHGLAADPESAGKDIVRLRAMLAKRFRISYIDSVKPSDIRLDQTEGDRALIVEYEVRRPLAYNLDFVAKFSDRVELRRGGKMPD